MKRDHIKKYLPILIVIAAAAVMIYMVKHRVRPEKAEIREMTVPVEVIPVKLETTRIRITGQGTVTPAVQVSLRPEVSGRIVSVHEDLVPGGTFQKWDILYRIDPRDYEARVATAEQTVANAELMLKQELARQRVAEREWTLLNGSVDTSQDNGDRELTLRIPQVKQARAAFSAAQESLRHARLNLDRCTVHAPFNAMVVREAVDVGQVVSNQSETAVLAGTDEYWVQVSIPMEHVVWIHFPKNGDGGSTAIIHQDTGNGSLKRTGDVARLMGDMAEAGRLARVLIRIPDPLKTNGERDLPLLIGSFVNVEIQGRELSDIVRIPREALHSIERGATGQIRTINAVWIMNGEDRLAIREVEVDWRTENEVFIHNSLKPGDRLIVSNIPTPLEGMKLTLSQAPPANRGADL